MLFRSDLLICEILRQNNCKLLNIGEMGIRINDSARRGLSDIVDSKEYIYGDLLFSKGLTFLGIFLGHHTLAM